MPKSQGNLIGAWAFLIGVILALVAGLLGSALTLYLSEATLLAILLVLGVVIGLLNISATEVKDFMMAGAILVVVAALGSMPLGAIPFVGETFKYLLVLFVPATIIVALKQVFSLAKK